MNDVDEGLDRVLSLLSSRAAGEASNDEVEAAIDELLGRNCAPGGTATVSAVDQQQHGRSNGGSARAGVSDSKKLAAESNIEEDLGDYDDAVEDDANGTQRSTSLVVRTLKRRRDSSGKKSGAPTSAEQSANWKLTYESIPLGHQGAKMMVAFGDGPNPLPAVVAKTLQSTRLMLLAAIRDARHVRRRHQRFYQQAVQHARGTMTKASAEALSKRPPPPVDAHLQFRAMHTHDELGKSHKCGFGTEELRVLYPEEINAYERWSELHHSTNVNNEDDVNLEDGTDKPVNEEVGSNELSTENSNVEEPNTDNEVAGGHLRERMEQFDIRTDRMDQDNYLQFSNVRLQGSFLPRRVIGEDRHRKPVRGRSADGSTTNMAIVMVRFLHWAGFEVGGVLPSSSGSEVRLPAPNADTTQVLAFLAHDFFGRIVEKAIFWRNVRDDETKVLLELPENEQLQESDIDRALEDPEIRLSPLYATRDDDSSTHPKPQLYFGPGFEERLEMELEEFAEPLTEEEIQAREEEEKFFAQLSQDLSPVLKRGGVVEAGSQDSNDANRKACTGTERRRQVMMEARRSRRSRAAANEQHTNESSDASEGEEEHEKEPRERRKQSRRSE